jgi:hypothetical protein
MYVMMTGSPVVDAELNVTSCEIGPGPVTVGAGLLNTQSGIVNWSVYLYVDAIVDPSKSMTTSATVLLMTRRRFVLR